MGIGMLGCAGRKVTKPPPNNRHAGKTLYAFGNVLFRRFFYHACKIIVDHKYLSLRVFRVSSRLLCG